MQLSKIIHYIIYVKLRHSHDNFRDILFPRIANILSHLETRKSLSLKTIHYGSQDTQDAFVI